jgi:hypothetical protein
VEEVEEEIEGVEGDIEREALVGEGGELTRTKIVQFFLKGKR